MRILYFLSPEKVFHHKFWILRMKRSLELDLTRSWTDPVRVLFLGKRNFLFCELVNKFSGTENFFFFGKDRFLVRRNKKVHHFSLEILLVLIENYLFLSPSPLCWKKLILCFSAKSFCILLYWWVPYDIHTIPEGISCQSCERNRILNHSYWSFFNIDFRFSLNNLKTKESKAFSKSSLK